MTRIAPPCLLASLALTPLDRSKHPRQRFMPWLAEHIDALG